MTTLRVIVDQMIAPVPGGIGRYTEELTRQLIATAPRGCDVEGIAASNTQEKYDHIRQRLPGLAGLHATKLARRELTAAWQMGLTSSPGPGMIHAPSLLAPLRKHDRSTGTQVAVTIHDVLAWTNPDNLTTQRVTWQKAVVKRARKYADAIIVPTHAVAEQLAEIADFGDRIRVIGGAAATTVRIPADADARAEALGLPERYILTLGDLEPRKGIGDLITGLGLPGAPTEPLVIVGPQTWGELNVSSMAEEAGLPEGRVRNLGFLSDEDLAVTLDRAAVFVYPNLAAGFGLPIVEAFKFGTPVIHSDSPALVEVAGDAGLIVEREGRLGYPERLAQAISRVLNDNTLADRLSVIASDRSHAFSWRDSAERVWQLHADL